MKNFTILLIASLLISWPSFTQTKSEILVKALETKRFKALVDRDFDFLENIFSQKLEYLHSNGQLDDKATYLGNLKAGNATYLEILPLNIDTKQYAKNIVVNRGKAQLRVKTSKDGEPFKLYFTSVYVKEKGGWKAVSWQSTRLPN